jgi:hypothetical protein
MVKFTLEEATIAGVHKAFKSRELTAKKLVEMYQKRIEAYDQKGPKLNIVIYLNPKALEAACEAGGHGTAICFGSLEEASSPAAAHPTATRSMPLKPSTTTMPWPMRPPPGRRPKPPAAAPPCSSPAPPGGGAAWLPLGGSLAAGAR